MKTITPIIFAVLMMGGCAWADAWPGMPIYRQNNPAASNCAGKCHGCMRENGEYYSEIKTIPVPYGGKVFKVYSGPIWVNPSGFK